MPKLNVYNHAGEQVGEMEVPSALFAAPVRKGALYNTAIAQAARRRHGTAATRTRAAVRGGGSKPWVQKGTGRARHGSTRSPIWTGGGVVFGPHPRDYAYSVPKKVRRVALVSALSAKAAQGKILVVEDIKLSEPKTKAVAGMLSNLNVTGGALIVMPAVDLNVVRSARNLPGVTTSVARQLNVLDILNHEYLIFTREALEQVQEVFGQ